ncbi:MAG: hypothetical protein JSV17_17330 [Candidatus Aminicenantes bacterium]|nr:MAG: hypothetical protein JSV17_17330 [Candidatus Aminicenantes bacterium]
MHKETISEYYLERYALGELPDEEEEKIRRLSSSTPEIHAALEEIKSSDRDILALYPPQTVKTRLLTLLDDKPSKPFPLRRVLTISSAVVTFLILILVLPLLKQKPRVVYPDAEQDVTLIKGIPTVDLSQTQLLVYRKIQDRVETLSDGEQAWAGDLLQLAYVTTQDSYGMILSIDGRGTVTLHLPENTGESTKLELRKQFLLPNAIELDDAPKFERFFFLTSESPIDVDGVLQEAQDMAKNPEQVKQENMDLPESFKQYSVLILKGEGS